MQIKLKRLDEAVKDFKAQFLWETDMEKAIEKVLSFLTIKMDIAKQQLNNRYFDALTDSIADIDKEMVKLGALQLNQIQRSRYRQIKEIFEGLYDQSEILKNKGSLALVSGKEVIEKEFSELKQMLKLVGERVFWLLERKVIGEAQIIRPIRTFVKEIEEYHAAVKHVQKTLEDENELLTVFDSLTKQMRFIYSDLSLMLDNCRKIPQKEVKLLTREMESLQLNIKSKWDRIISLTGKHLERIARENRVAVVKRPLGEVLDGIEIR